MDDKKYKKKIFDEEFGKKDESTLFYAGLIFFLILFVATISIWSYFENVKVAEEQKKIADDWQKYYQSIEYQKQQKYEKQRQIEYQKKMDEYNNTIARIQQTPISIDN